MSDTDDPTATPTRRRSFGTAFKRAMHLSGVTQTELAERLMKSQSLLPTWATGAVEPTPQTVFDLEDELRVPPGFLSNHLGYTRADADRPRHPAALRAALLDDPALSDDQRRLMVEVYEALTEEQVSRYVIDGRVAGPSEGAE